MTPMSAWYWGRPDIEGPFLAAMPLGRWATEAEIAAPIVFLKRDDLEGEALGDVKPGDPHYDRYRDRLRRAIEDGVAQLITI